LKEQIKGLIFFGTKENLIFYSAKGDLAQVQKLLKKVIPLTTTKNMGSSLKNSFLIKKIAQLSLLINNYCFLGLY
jgi:hypothetical protein